MQFYLQKTNLRFKVSINYILRTYLMTKFPIKVWIKHNTFSGGGWSRNLYKNDMVLQNEGFYVQNCYLVVSLQYNNITVVLFSAD